MHNKMPAKSKEMPKVLGVIGARLFEAVTIEILRPFYRRAAILGAMAKPQFSLGFLLFAVVPGVALVALFHSLIPPMGWIGIDWLVTAAIWIGLKPWTVRELIELAAQASD